MLQQAGERHQSEGDADDHQDPREHPRRPQFMTSDKFNALRNRLYGLLREEIRQTVRQNI